MSLPNKIKNAVEKFDLKLDGYTVLTEAATGNYVVTSILAAVAGARKVYALAKDSQYGSFKEVKGQTNRLARSMGVEKNISIVDNLLTIDLDSIDILTNSGFLRPINREFVKRLPSKCVIPLMWEPWEWRPEELDLDACSQRGIKVYGTNESDPRVRTMDYLGYTVLSLLLENKLAPFGTKVLLVGCERLVQPVYSLLRLNDYELRTVTDYQLPFEETDNTDAIVVLEHERDVDVIGNTNAYIDNQQIRDDTLVIHICGRVSFAGASYLHVPNNPRPFGFMSLTADYADPRAVVDLNAAGLKVAQGMLHANKISIEGFEYKDYLERNYPALAFDDRRYW